MFHAPTAFCVPPTWNTAVARLAAIASIHATKIVPANSAAANFKRVWEANMFTILLVILILMLVGALPAWPYSRSWGYYPSGGLGLVVVILLVLILMR
jgi:Protein of unknown function (DUF3309)